MWPFLCPCCSPSFWFEAPLGFGLLMCCRIIQVFQLYHLFVKRHLPPVEPYVLLLCIMCPWIGTAAFIRLKQPLNHLCHLKKIRWSIPVASLDAVYIATLVFIMWRFGILNSGSTNLRTLCWEFSFLPSPWEPGLLLSSA